MWNAIKYLTTLLLDVVIGTVTPVLSIYAAIYYATGIDFIHNNSVILNVMLVCIVVISRELPTIGTKRNAR